MNLLHFLQLKLFSKRLWQKRAQALNTRIGLFWWIIGLFWVKTVLAYALDFKWLHVQNLADLLVLLANPIGFSIVLASLILYVKPTRLYYLGSLVIDIGATLLLYMNILYYREFNDFMSVNVILGYKTVNQGFDLNAIPLSFQDWLFWIDIVIIVFLFISRKVTFDHNRIPLGKPFQITTIGIFLTLLTTFTADLIRPQLLTKQFDREYLVRYVGLGPFTILDGISTQQTAEERKSAQPSQIDIIKNYIQTERYVAPDSQYFGLAKNRNVIIIHLESFQQFLIDQKINGKEVTPFINSLYHSNSSFAFSNFFHEVGQGKTSDAENLMETSTYGLPNGSLFSKLGADQTFQSMPAILNENAGYSSAVFHGNVPTFWNRNLVYKNMGYQNFFDSTYYDASGDKATNWGLKDKLLFKDSIPLLEQLQQPFYTKYITVTNHTPYTLDSQDQDPNFQTTDSGSKTVDNYFQTAHYLDQAVKEFFNYLNKSGLLNRSMIVLYGDHYGISDADSKYLAPYIGQNSDTWSDYNVAQLQRVPFIINVPDKTTSGIQSTFGGELDAAPTIEHLLGINNNQYIQFGQDLLSPKREQLVVFRNGNFVTPTFTNIGEDDVYNTKTGQLLTELDKKDNKILASDQKQASELLSMSDRLNQKNLLRFYTPEGFTPVNPTVYNYGVLTTLDRLKKQQEGLGVKSTSILSNRNGQSSASLYQTDAPEANDQPSDSTRIKQQNPDEADSE